MTGRWPTFDALSGAFLPWPVPVDQHQSGLTLNPTVGVEVDDLVVWAAALLSP
jgi:hypothetical protein